MDPQRPVEPAVREQEREVAKRTREVPLRSRSRQGVRGEAGGEEVERREQRHHAQDGQGWAEAPPVEPALERGHARPRRAGPGATSDRDGGHAAQTSSLIPPRLSSSTASAWACFIASRAFCCLVAMRSMALLILSPAWGNTGTVPDVMYPRLPSSATPLAYETARTWPFAA